MEKDNYINTSIKLKEESKYLPGSVSGNQYLFYTHVTFDKYGKDKVPDYKYLSLFLSDDSDIKQDYENDIFVSENGAVFDAYNFSGLSDEERFQAIESIMLDVQSEYPDYKFSMIPGNFPIDAFVDTYYEGQNKKEQVNIGMSTHILYITNYKEHLSKKTDSVKGK